METPQDMIQHWKREIKSTRAKNMLEVIKMDIEAEKDMFEDVVREYQDLIYDVENKLDKSK